MAASCLSWRWCLAAVFAVAVALPASAGSRISNVILDLDARGRGATTVTNIDQRPLGFVVTPLAWRVENGEDSYGPTEEFIAVPPSFQLEPGESKTVRVGFRRRLQSDREQTFRLSIREVPPETEGEGIAMAFEHLLPVYVAPDVRVVRHELQAAIAEASGERHLRISNVGNRRATLRAVLVRSAEGNDRARLDVRQRSTVLAGSWREWPLPEDFTFRPEAGDQLVVELRSGTQTEVRYADSNSQ